jgi:hypothetical protein
MIDASVITDLKYAALWTGAMLLGFLARRFLISDIHNRPLGPTDKFIGAYPIRGFIALFALVFLFVNVLDSIWLLVGADPESDGMTTIGQYVFSLGITAAVMTNFFLIRKRETNKGSLSESNH